MQNPGTEPNQEASDLRVRRTRKLLREALIALSREQGFKRVSVSAITKRAMVNRATFYRHYQDKYDLAETCVKELLDALPFPQPEGRQVPHQHLRAIATQLFTHIWEQAELYRTLSGEKGWKEFLDCLGAYFDRLMRQHFQGMIRRPEPAEIPMELCVTFINTAGLSTIKWWLAHELSTPPEQVSAWFMQLVKPSLSQLLRVQADENDKANSKTFSH